jgi:hypothetical protein
MRFVYQANGAVPVRRSDRCRRARREAEGIAAGVPSASTPSG